MGACLCRKKSEIPDVTSHSTSTMSDSEPAPKRPRLVEDEPIEELITEVLHFIGTVQQGGQDNAVTPVTRLQTIAETEEGWCHVILALIRTIPLHDPLGPSAITIILEESPLPSTETLVGQFTRSLNLTSSRVAGAYQNDLTLRYERNLLVILGCIAEKFAGRQSAEVLTNNVIAYLIQFLVDEKNPQLVLHALVALEKFAVTAKNKVKIERALRRMLLHPLLPLQFHSNSRSYPWREVGFNARWSLDNTFLVEGRRFTYETIQLDNINAMLNNNDKSPYMKVSADGLEARCDSHSFESIRGTFEINSHAWYYEVEIMTAGVMQIGWATLSADFKNQEGYGVGDDSFSLAYDGCRRLIWHKAEPTPTFAVPSWQVGDILGCLIDVARQEAIFSLNGKRIEPFNDIFSQTRVKWIESEGICSEGFYAAASFMAHQQCRFNFGSEKFVHPPTDREYRAMNKYGVLGKDAKMVLPLRVSLKTKEKEPRQNVEDLNERCAVCLDVLGKYRVQPCDHGGFCITCVKKLPACPLCRGPISDYFALTL